MTASGDASGHRTDIELPAELASIDGELSAIAGGPAPDVPASLTDRVMLAVDRERIPTPPVAFLRSVSTRSSGDAWGGFRATVRAAFGRGVPVLIRAQAAFVVVALGLVLAAGVTVAAVGAGEFVRVVQGPMQPPIDEDTGPGEPARSVAPPASDAPRDPDETETPAPDPTEGAATPPGPSPTASGSSTAPSRAPSPSPPDDPSAPTASPSVVPSSRPSASATPSTSPTVSALPSPSGSPAAPGPSRSEPASSPSAVPTGSQTPAPGTSPAPTAAQQ